MGMLARPTLTLPAPPAPSKVLRLQVYRAVYTAKPCVEYHLNRNLVGADGLEPPTLSV